MPLLRLKEMIINTEHIVRVDYQPKSITDSVLVIYLSDLGQRDTIQSNIVRLTGFDANLMWSALSQTAQPIVPAPPKK